MNQSDCFLYTTGQVISARFCKQISQKSVITHEFKYENPKFKGPNAYPAFYAYRIYDTHTRKLKIKQSDRPMRPMESIYSIINS